MQAFELSLATEIRLDSTAAAQQRAANMLRRDMRKVLGACGPENEIVLRRSALLPPEAWRMAVSPDSVTVTYADDLGAVYALLTLSETALGVAPLWFWNDQRLERRETVRIPCGERGSRPAAVRYRGWFINDEVLLSAWSLDGSRDKPWEMAFEALLRLGGNLVIPGTDKNAHRYRALAASFGLYVTHHHAEPLGAAMFRRAYPELIPSYKAHPALFEQLWREAIQAQKDMKVVWNLGFRGQGDRPFWEDEPQYDTPAKRGALISALIRRQYEMVQEALPGAPCCTNLYGEVMELYRDGLIELPGEIIRVWADNGYGRMVTRRQGNHNPRVRALPAQGSAGAHGLYYHASFYDLQAASHMTLLPNSPEFVRGELQEAMRLGVSAYWIVNCSNIKPHVYLLDYLAALWREGDMDPRRHRLAYCERYYGQENAQRVADCFAAYYAHALPYGCHADERAGEQFGNHGARMLVSQWMRDADQPADGMRWATDAPTLRGQVVWYREKCEEAVRGYSALWQTCERTLPQLTGPGRTLLEDSVMMQAGLLLHTYEGARLAMESLLLAMDRDWLQAFYAAGKSRAAYLAADQTMRDREHGHWRLFYANDCLADVKQSAWLMGVLMGVLRNHGDGPHFYQWQRRFLDAPEDAGVMLILNMENHLNNDELFALMQARME
ncbi:MAG: glycosyl hydrolase 115 family protein [Candidatus Ventricola sp.]